MSYMDESGGLCAKLKVVGVGGGGCNAINNMIEAGVQGVEFVAVNTDIQSLTSNKAAVKIQVGTKVTRGLGAGANPEIGRQAAVEDAERIAEQLKGADMVIITCGLGGGTGTGASPVIAEISKEMGALTVAVVTKPFAFEGKMRNVQADDGLAKLKSHVDTLITIPNQRLLSVGGNHMTIKDAFLRVDEVLLYAVRSISDLIVSSGYVTVDFADVKTVMSEKGTAIMGVGLASGDRRAIEAAQKAVSSPLLEGISIHGARSILINVTGSSNIALHEVHEAATLIQEQAHEDARVIWGLVLDDAMNDTVRITVIATGFEEQVVKAKGRPEKPFENKGVPAYLKRNVKIDYRGDSKSKSARIDLVDERYDIPTFLRKQPAVDYKPLTNLKLYFDLDSYDAESIANVISALSNYYEHISSDKLRVIRTKLLPPGKEVFTVPKQNASTKSRGGKA